MDYRRLGGTGLEVSAISLGAWATFGERLDDDETMAVLAAAYDRGINFFDAAETYADGAAEAALGRAFRRLAWPRETFLVSSKAYWGVHQRRPNTWGLSRKHLFDACHAALARMQVEYLDLYFCHRHDEQVPLIETVRAMSDLVRQGKVLHWGTSEWPAARLREAHALAVAGGLVPPQVEQLQYNLLVREKVEQEIPGLRRDLQLGLTTWSPLCYGLLTGRHDAGVRDGRLAREKYRWLRTQLFGDDEESVLRRVRGVSRIAAEIGTQPNRLALAWVLRNRDVHTAITGASHPSQVEDNVEALALVARLDADLWRHVEAELAPAPPEDGK